jgi:hypothetical protein
MIMFYVRIIDADGYFVKDEFVSVMTNLTVAVQCPPGFYRPHWNFETQKWEEGGAAPEPAIHEPTLDERNRADIDYLAMMMEVEL